MSANELLISVGLSVAGVAVIGGIAALLISVHYPEVMSRPTPHISEAAINVPIERDSTIMALDDDDNHNDNDDDDEDGHGWGHHGTAPLGPKRGSDSNAAGKAAQNGPGETRDRIERRNADQVERDALNNRRALNGLNPQGSTQSGRHGISPRVSDGSATRPADPGGPGPAIASPPSGLSLPPIATVPLPSIASTTPDNAVIPRETVAPRVAEETIADIAETTPPAVGRPLPDGFRVGYSQALRSAALPELAAVALSGAAGIALFVAFGGLIGYRQAKAGHALPASGAARFVR